MITARRLLLLLPLLCLAGGGLSSLRAQQSSDQTSNSDRTLAPYFWIPQGSDGGDPFPLEKTNVDVSIAGVIARVEMNQVWVNRGSRVIEAVYVFPASTRAAVHDLVMRIGKRVIRAEIRERGSARREYDQARQEGKTATLLEQERDNVFQMSVANILPGDRITVSLTYSEILVQEDGRYELVVPTVVGPRYSNQSAPAAPDMDCFVASPYLPAGTHPLSELGIIVDISAGMALGRVESPSHWIAVTRPDLSRAVVELRDSRGGDRDFILHHGLSGDRLQSGLLLYQGEEENFFLLLVQPPERIELAEWLPREYVFVLDVSGSMAGFPLEMAKTLVVDLLGNLREVDRFNLVLFESDSAVLSTEPLRASKENIDRGLAFVSAARGGGGTELLPALERAIDLPGAADRVRTIIVCTDGYVDCESAALALVRRNLDRANVFAFGIGTSVNRYLIEGLARAGSGEAFFVLGPGLAEAQRFRTYVSGPLLRDVDVEVSGLAVEQVVPQVVPTLFASRPIAVYGKWYGPRQGTVSVTGRSAVGEWRSSFDVASVEPLKEHAALRELWARRRVGDLCDDASFSGDPDLFSEDITRLGLGYRLLTPFTSFVAVDQRVRTHEKGETVLQPLPLPAGVPSTAIGASAGALLS